MATYILVDFTNLIHRCKHITSHDVDIKTGMALHITLNSMRKMWRKFNGSHIVICLEGRSWRKEFYPEYKAQRRLLESKRTRREIEDDKFYFETMNNFVKFLETKTNVTVLQTSIAEADDMIARWIHLHPSDNHVICSSDTDFYQLLSDNVKMYDGVKDWTISNQEVLDEKDKPAKIKRNVKVVDQKSGKTITKTVESIVEAPNAEYELFKKIIRGDSSDNIMGAYPGVREKGTKKAPGIIQAFADRENKGYEWNQFMLHEWTKLVGVDENDMPITKKVRVIDEYKIIKKLIDLSAQPEDVKEVIDHDIKLALQKPKKDGIGIWFLRYVQEMDLVDISKNPTEYAKILSASYN